MLGRLRQGDDEFEDTLNYYFETSLNYIAKSSLKTVQKKKTNKTLTYTKNKTKPKQQTSTKLLPVCMQRALTLCIRRVVMKAATAAEEDSPAALQTARWNYKSSSSTLPDRQRHTTFYPFSSCWMFGLFPFCIYYA